ncbi:MAG: zinc ribbon domain-containing protein [Acidobacteriota bacterium]
MPLIACPECKKLISDEARRCPNCGHPIPFKFHNVWIRISLASIIAAIGLYLVFNGAVMPGGVAIFFGLFMVLFGGLVIIATLWKILVR